MGDDQTHTILAVLVMNLTDLTVTALPGEALTDSFDCLGTDSHSFDWYATKCHSFDRSDYFKTWCI